MASSSSRKEVGAFTALPVGKVRGQRGRALNLRAPPVLQTLWSRQESFQSYKDSSRKQSSRNVSNNHCHPGLELHKVVSGSTTDQRVSQRTLTEVRGLFSRTSSLCKYRKYFSQVIMWGWCQYASTCICPEDKATCSL